MQYPSGRHDPGEPTSSWDDWQRPIGGNGAPSPRRRGRRSRWAKAGYIIASLLAVVVLVAGIGGYVYYRHLDSNITVVNVGGLSGRTIYGAQNILVLGSQVRAGQHGHLFGIAPGSSIYTSNSDNLLVVHLDPTHTHATILSIPRDTFVYEPGCKARSKMIGTGTMGPYDYPPGNIIDGALNIGGPTCAVKTVEALTGIKIDHFIEFNFNSFRRMVDTIGGVWVCVPRGGYHDPKSGLNLGPGRHKVTYNQALAYVRTRSILGGPDAGGDLPRIALQQAFISSLIQNVDSRGLLGDTPTLLSIADTATKALTVDRGLGSVSSLLSLAKSLIHLKPKDVSLITMPTQPDSYEYPKYSQHSMVVQPQDDILFGMLLNNQAWTGHLPTMPPAKVQVRVLNATGQSNLAAHTATKLRRLGYDVVSVGDSTATNTTTVTFSGVAQADSAYTLMTALKSMPTGQNLLAEPASQLGSAGPVTLILGSDFAGVKTPAQISAPTSGTTKKHHHNSNGGVQSRNAAANICKGLPKATN